MGKRSRRANRQQRSLQRKEAREEPRRISAKKYLIPIVATSLILGIGSLFLLKRERAINSLEKKVNMPVYEAPITNDIVIQKYLDELLIELKAEGNPYFEAIERIIYDPIDTSNEDALYAKGGLAVAKTKKVPHGKKTIVKLTKYAFDKRYVKNIEELKAILDNESFHAAEMYFEGIYVPDIDARDEDKPQVESCIGYLNSSPYLIELMKEYFGSLHELTFISEGRRKVSDRFLEMRINTYNDIRRIIQEKLKGRAPFDKDCAVFLEHTSPENIRDGKVKSNLEIER